VAAYREAGGRGPLRLQVHLSWAPNEEQAMAIAHEQWRSNVFAAPACWDIDSVETFDEVSAQVPLERVRSAVLISHEPGQHAQWLHEFVELGFTELYLHHVGQEQRGFIDVFGERVLPQLAATPAASARTP